MVTAREIAEENLILMATVGSTVHGLNLPGADDHDEMGVCIEPPEYVIGLDHFEQDVYRTKPQGVRSEHGDTDRTVYSLRKFASLAIRGNPTILLLFFSQPSFSVELGLQLQESIDRFAARSAGHAFLGYMTQQRQRLTGERGQMNVNRPELIEAFGYDTKYAMQMLRLGFQGVEFLQTGQLSLPMREPERSFVFSVREGKVDINDVLTRAGELEREVKLLLDDSPLPEKPDREWINAWLVRAYKEWWAR